MNIRRAWTIDVSPEEPDRGRAVWIRAIDIEGQPVPDAPIEAVVDGDGTLMASAVVKQRVETTDSEGMTSFAWWEYPRFSPRRALHSTVYFESTDPRVLSISAPVFMEF